MAPGRRDGAQSGLSHETAGEEARLGAASAAEEIFLSRTGLLSVLVVLATGVLGVAFWTFKLPILDQIDPDYVPIALLASISYVILALPLLALTHGQKHQRLRMLSIALAAGLILMFLLKGLDDVTGLGTDIEHAIAPGPDESAGFPANRISPIAAVCIFATSFSILVLLVSPRSSRTLRSLASLTSISVMLVGIIAVLGYAYGTPMLYGGEVRPVALSSAIAVFFLGLGVTASGGPGLWPLSLFIGPTVRARMMRAFLPLTTVVVFIVGVATVRVSEVSANPVLGASLIAILTALLIGALVYRLSFSIGGQIDHANATRREAEAKLRSANEKLTMLGSITRHDILNQVGVLKGWSALSEEAVTEKERTDALRRITNASRSIEQLVAFTGVYQEVGLKEPEWIRLQSAFEGGVAGVSRISVRVIINVDGLAVFADRMLEKVFTNLVDNSMRHGEHVSQISLSYSRCGSGLNVIYEDDGVGIPDSDKDRLFVRGYGKHTGLGLYLSREILAITGLTISETGVPGKGARFEIYVPPGKFRIESKRASGEEIPKG